MEECKHEIMKPMNHPALENFCQCVDCGNCFLRKMSGFQQIVSKKPVDV